MTGPVETGSSLAVNDEIADDRASGRLFPASARGAFDERNFVRKAVNWALRIIGMRNLAAIRRTLQATYDEALPRVPEALKSEGFGVRSETDLQNTLKQKLGVDFRRYTMLGACNPPFAYQALQAELETGLMLPCNVVVYEHNARQAVVLAIDPTKTVAGTGNTMLVELAEAVKEKLSRALAPRVRDRAPPGRGQHAGSGPRASHGRTHAEGSADRPLLPERGSKQHGAMSRW